MIIYLAGAEPEAIDWIQHVLLSYYDIALSDLPFRKKTWQLLITNAKRKRQSQDSDGKEYDLIR